MGIGKVKGRFVHEVIRQLHHYLLDEPAVQSLEGEGCVSVPLRNLLGVGLMKMVVEHDRLCLAIGKELIVLLKLSCPNGTLVLDDVEVDLLNLDVMFLNWQAGTKERLR